GSRGPRWSAVVEGVIENAFIWNDRLWLMVTGPSVAVTDEVYAPTGSIEPSFRRPLKTQVRVPAPMGALARWVATTAPERSRIVHVTCAGRVTLTDRLPVGASRSRSWG